MSRARDLSKLGNPNVIVADTERVGFGTQVPENAANASSSLISAGIVTATAFYGDGSNLEGVASAGLGTAVDDTKDSIGQNIYFTNAELSINANTTVNAPDSSNIAYTQYQQVTVESGSELIIADGDSFIPDVLGIGTALQASTAGAGNGLFGTVFADNIENAAGRGGPHFPLGITVAGVSTLSGNVSIGGTLTYEDVTNVDSIGVVTARSGIKVTAGGIDVTGNSNIAGDFGVGTASPSARLDVRRGDADGKIAELHQSTGYGFDIGSSQADAYISSGYAQNFIFKTNAGSGQAERLRIGSGGQIGIGGANYGTSGQVLTSQGGSAAPQWATPGGGSWEVASTTVLAGSTSEIIYNGWDTDVQQYKVSWNGLYTASNMYVRMQYYFDTTAGNAGTLQTSGSGYFTTSDINDFGSSPSNTGSTAGDYVQISASSQKSYAAGEMTFNMKLNVADGQAHYAWGFVASGEQGGFLRNRYNYHDDKFRTGVKIYFINNSGIVSPTRGRVTWYKLKYS